MDININKIFDNSGINNDALSDMLLKDFLMQVEITSLALLIRHLIAEAKTPEEKETLRAIPDQILDTWEKRISSTVLTDCAGYMDTLLRNETSHYANEELLKVVAQKLADNEQQCFKGLMDQLRNSFLIFKESLV